MARYVPRPPGDNTFVLHVAWHGVWRFYGEDEGMPKAEFASRQEAEEAAAAVAAEHGWTVIVHHWPDDRT